MTSSARGLCLVLVLLTGSARSAVAEPALSSPDRPSEPARHVFPLRVSDNCRYLVDARGTPFFPLGDTPWFIQKLTLPDAQMLMGDRLNKGFNTLVLELRNDSRIASRDGCGR